MLHANESIFPSGQARHKHHHTRGCSKTFGLSLPAPSFRFSRLEEKANTAPCPSPFPCPLQAACQFCPQTPAWLLTSWGLLPHRCPPLSPMSTETTPKPDLPPLKLPHALKGTPTPSGKNAKATAGFQPNLLQAGGSNPPIKLEGGGIAIVDRRSQPPGAEISGLYSNISTDDTEPLTEEVVSEVQALHLEQGQATISSHNSHDGSEIIESR